MKKRSVINERVNDATRDGLEKIYNQSPQEMSNFEIESAIQYLNAYGYVNPELTKEVLNDLRTELNYRKMGGVNENKNKEIVKITESQLRRLIGESLKNALNEIELDTLENVRDESNYLSGMLMNLYNEWEQKTNELCKALQNRYGRGKEDYNEPNVNTQGTKLSYELESMRNKIKSFVERKYEQTDSFEKGIEDRYVKRFGGNDREMGDKFSKYANKHGWDSIDNGEWRKNNLTPQEQDYYDYQTKNNRL